MQRAIVTGAAGQDGSYMVELLLSRGVEVWAVFHKQAFNFAPNSNLHIVWGDITDREFIFWLVGKYKPDLYFNFAAQSHVGISFKLPRLTWDSIVKGTENGLDAIKKFVPGCRFYQASSSEMFGDQPAPQSLKTPFKPVSPYGEAKLRAHKLTEKARKQGIFAVCGILFNHESERRGHEFVTRKITRALVRMKLKQQETLSLGYLQAKRDWGYAPDYVDAIYDMVVLPHVPGTHIIATGTSHSVLDFLFYAANYLKLDLTDRIKFDAKEVRPRDINHLQGPTRDCPTTAFNELVRRMLDNDLKELT